MNDDDLGRHDLARRRFFAIQAARIGGLALLLTGILSIHGGIALPREVGYVLAPVGLVLFAVLPVMLARRWKSRAS
jgi:hypothetical protein